MLCESHIDSHTSPSLRCAKRTQKGRGRRGSGRGPKPRARFSVHGPEPVNLETVGFPTRHNTDCRVFSSRNIGSVFPCNPPVHGFPPLSLPPTKT